MLESLFNKVAALKSCNLTKKILQASRFPVNIAKILRTVFYSTPLVAASVNFSEHSLETTETALHMCSHKKVF